MITSICRTSVFFNADICYFDSNAAGRHRLDVEICDNLQQCGITTYSIQVRSALVGNDAIFMSRSHRIIYPRPKITLETFVLSEGLPAREKYED